MIRLHGLVRQAAVMQHHSSSWPVAYDVQFGAFSLDRLPLRLTALDGEYSLVSCCARSMSSTTATFSARL